MQLNHVRDRDVETFVHEAIASANSPEWSSPHHVGRTLTGILHDPITSADVMKSKVTEWMNDLVAERGRNCEGAAVDQRACSSRGETASVANRATHCIEQRVATDGRSWKRTLPAW